MPGFKPRCQSSPRNWRRDACAYGRRPASDTDSVDIPVLFRDKPAGRPWKQWRTATEVRSTTIAHTYIKPRTPRLNGKAERSHRIDAEEFYRLLNGVIIDDAEVFNDKLREWEDYDNYHRPHGGLRGQTRTKDSSRRPPVRRDPGVSDHRRSHTDALQGYPRIGVSRDHEPVRS
ncbi:integrase core domain-containing protein [Streptomyces sp. WMMC500]|uniref:integrase core domain-containing protein n=1 Tax=Streptomyces sp. WMMC500 TaxID=3015154 RepID=UPI00248C22C9|nr:integrase core domain-containing protein [Streptomyces sp. WMMC500]WBB63036.1 integrase core domain-containing protein [Streptomyces sp. WMMC500]